MTKSLSAMVILIEPAPYVTSLIEELQIQWGGPLHSWFVGAAVTQSWMRNSGELDYEVLPISKKQALAKLWKEMRRIRPSVVFVAGWSHPLIVACIIMGRLVGAKVVAMSDTWSSSSSGLRSWAKGLVFRMVHRFTPAGKRQAAYLRMQGVPLDRIFPANMTSDTHRMRCFIDGPGQQRRHEIRAAIGVSKNATVFLFVGRLEPVKGPDLLLTAFTAAPRTETSKLIVVGEGSMQEHVISAARVDQRIVYRGRLEGEELWSQFAAADVLVVPSRSESWGLVINEALCAGLGIVLHDCCGCIDDLIVEGRTGLVVPTGDPDFLRLTLFNLAQDPALLAVFRQNSTKLIEGWTTAAWASNILAAWRDALGTCQRGMRKDLP